MWIYRIKNLSNGKMYIGQTVNKDPLLRIRSHFKNTENDCHKFHRAARKYGSSLFLCSIICQCFSQEDLNAAEIYFIRFYDSIKNGYNIREGGSKGKHDISTKKKMRIKGLKRYNISLKINDEIKEFILNNIKYGRNWIREELNRRYDIRCSCVFITKFIANNRSQDEYKTVNKKLSLSQRKEISQTLKNKNESNRIKRLGMSKKKFFELGNKCKDFTEFSSYFKCKKSFLINCLSVWTGKSSWYEVFNKKKIAHNKKAESR